MINQSFVTEYQPYIFIIIGLIALALSAFWQSTKSKLKQTEIPVDGIVFEQDFDGNAAYSFNNSSSFIKDKITIRFVTQAGEWVTGTLKQDFGVYYTGQYKNGDVLKLYYDKDNPSEFYVDTKQSEFIGRIIVGLVGFVFFSIGLYKIFA